MEAEIARIVQEAATRGRPQIDGAGLVGQHDDVDYLDDIDAMLRDGDGSGNGNTEMDAFLERI